MSGPTERADHSPDDSPAAELAAELAVDGFTPDEQARLRADVIAAQSHLAAAIDSRDWAAIAATMLPDATAYSRTGPEAIVAIMRNSLGGVGPTQHLLGNHRVTLRRNETRAIEARALTYGRVHHVGAGPMAGQFFECLGEYDDTWRLVDGTWRVAHRWFEIRISLGTMAVLRPAEEPQQQQPRISPESRS